MKTNKSKRKFPCPYCKGKGSWIEPVLYDGIGGGPLETCNQCDGEGMILIGGKKHTEIRAFNIGCDVLWFGGKNKDKTFSYRYITNIGKKALRSV